MSGYTVSSTIDLTKIDRESAEKAVGKAIQEGEMHDWHLMALGLAEHMHAIIESMKDAEGFRQAKKAGTQQILFLDGLRTIFDHLAAAKNRVTKLDDIRKTPRDARRRAWAKGQLDDARKRVADLLQRAKKEGAIFVKLAAHFKADIGSSLKVAPVNFSDPSVN